MKAQSFTKTQIREQQQHILLSSRFWDIVMKIEKIAFASD
jgi:hypothetical protein